MKRAAMLALGVVAMGCHINPNTGAAPTNAPSAMNARAKNASDNGFKGDPRRVYQLSDLATTDIKVNGHTIPVWIMDTDSKRQEGMMWLSDKQVSDDQGMLFVFPDKRPLGFWMKNTVLPLDIIYISESKKVLNIQKGKPFDEETSLPSSGPGKYVLEMKQGSAERLGIKAGTEVEFPSDVKATE